MFRIEIFCEDKNLAPIMHVLIGKAVKVDVQPVANAKVQNGKVIAKTSGDKIQMMVDEIVKSKLTMIDAAFAKKFAVSIGLQPKSYGYLLKQAISRRLLKKVGKGFSTTYKLTVQKGPAK